MPHEPYGMLICLGTISSHIPQKAMIAFGIQQDIKLMQGSHRNGLVNLSLSFSLQCPDSKVHNHGQESQFRGHYARTSSSEAGPCLQMLPLAIMHHVHCPVPLCHRRGEGVAKVLGVDYIPLCL